MKIKLACDYKGSSIQCIKASYIRCMHDATFFNY